EALVDGATIPLTASGSTYAGAWTAKGEGKTFQVLGRFADAAGNVATVPLGSVAVDGTAPFVRDAQIGFAGGRSVGRLGETATLTLDAVDNVSDTARLVAEADLANVSTTTRVTLRYDAEIERFTATFPVNRLPAQGQALGVLSVRDQAGNVALTNFTVLTNGSPAQIGAVVVDAATSGATVSWTTPNATRGRV